jgi:hypothetical protein
MPPIFSALDTIDFTPPDSPRTYTLAPLTYRERQAYRRDLRIYGGVQPDRAVVMAGIRDALRQVAPANLDECLAIVDEAEAALGDEGTAARLAVVEQAIVDVPSYQAINQAQQRWRDAAPFVSAMHALRGWDGPGLPRFARDGGRVPEALLDHVPPLDMAAVGWRAFGLIHIGPDAEKNFEAPSPSPATPAPTTEG